MKNLENKNYVFKGSPILDENQKPVDTVRLLLAIVENSQYQTSGQILKALKISSKITEIDGKISLEDEDFEFVKAQTVSYKPLLEKGLTFAEFYQQLENA